MPETVSSRSWSSWLPAFLKAKPAPLPIAAAPSTGVSQGPPPRGPRRGTLVAVSLYLPYGMDPVPIAGELVRLGYSNLEVRDARHADTKTRITAAARIPVLECSEHQVEAAILARLPVPASGPRFVPRIDVTLAATY